MRDDGTDLSLEVRQFCRDRNVSVPAPKPSAPPAYPPGSANAPYFSRSTQCEPRTKSMEDTTFNDLFLRVGAFIAIQIISYHAGFHTAESSVQSCVNMVVGVVSIEVSCMALSVLCNWDRAPKLHIGARDSAGKPSACSLSAYNVSIPRLEHTAVGFVAAHHSNSQSNTRVHIINCR